MVDVNMPDTIPHTWKDIEGIQICFAQHCNQTFNHAHHALNATFSEPMQEIDDLFTDENRTDLNSSGELNVVRRLKNKIIATMTATATKTADDKRVSVLIDPLLMSYFRITVDRL